MGAIDNFLRQIRQAIYGKDVRESIAKGIEQCYSDAVDVVKVSDTPPTGENVKLWVKPEPDEFQVPTWAEHQEVADDVNDLRSALNDVNDTFADELGVKNYIFTYGAWVTTTTTTVDPTNLDSNANRVYCILDCQPGDEFDVKLGGVNSSHRPYSFIDLNNGVLEQATSNGKTGTITAPENAVKLVLNSGTGIDYYCVKNNSRLTSIENQINALDDEIERQDAIIEEITETVNLVDQNELLNATGWTENNGVFLGHWLI